MNLFTKKAIILSFIASVILSTTAWVEDPPNYHSGAPGELTCASCHVPPSSNASTGLIEITGLPDTLHPDTDYPITVRMTKTFGDASQAGFQMTLINERLEKIGTFSNPSAGSAVTVQPYRDYFEHRPAAIIPAGNVVEWTVNWRSPKEEEAFTQTLKIYASSLLGNADSSYTGDITLNTIKTLYYESPYTRLSGDIGHTDITCSGGSDGTATANISGGRKPYRYTWNTGDTTQTVDGLSAGTYSLTITDDGIDTLVRIVSISQPFPVFGEIIKTDIPCNSSVAAEAIIVPSSGVPPYTFLWSNGATTNTTSFSAPGAISVEITDANGCTYTAVSSIIKKGDFTASITNISNVKCNGGATGSATAIATIPFPTSYLWSNGATTASVVGLTAGDYSVTISNTDGCEARATVTILEPPPIQVKSNQINQPSCQGSYNGFISIFADGGVPPYTYEWEDGSTLKSLSSLIAGDYSVTATDAFGCQASGTFTLSEPLPMSIIIDHLDESAPGAKNGKALILPSGGTAPYTYAWSDGLTTKDRNNLAPGYYTVTVTDVKGCSSENAVYIYPYSCDLVVNHALINNVACNGNQSGSIELDVSGGEAPYTFKWSDGSTEKDLLAIKAGQYKVTITDAAGCSTGGFFKVNQPPPFKKTLTVEDVTNPDFVDGKVKFVFSGGVPPYQLIFDVSDTISTYTGIVSFENLFNGLHSYTVTDANGCSYAEFFVINVAGCQLRPGNVVIQDVKCFGQEDGAICISVQNATGSYELFWDDESSELCRLDLSAGKYNLHISDEAGCQSLDTFTIKQPAQIRQVNANTVKPDEGQNNGTISVVNAGGIPPYRYTWYKDGVIIDGEESSQSGLGSGKYVYILEDANGCLFTSDTFDLVVGTISVDRAEQRSLRIFPNPTNSVVTCQLEQAVAGRVVIYNSLGTAIKAFDTDGSNRIQLDLSSMPSGIYRIVVDSARGLYSGTVVRLE